MLIYFRRWNKCDINPTHHSTWSMFLDEIWLVAEYLIEVYKFITDTIVHNRYIVLSFENKHQTSDTPLDFFETVNFVNWGKYADWGFLSRIFSRLFSNIFHPQNCNDELVFFLRPYVTDPGVKVARGVVGNLSWVSYIDSHGMCWFFSQNFV